MKDKKGFTLAEVMITLGILGVLAAIIIPAVANVSPDVSRVMFKKAYSTLEKTVSNMINDDTSYPSEMTGTTTDTGRSVAQGLYYDTDVSGISKFCSLFSQSVNTVGNVDCTMTGASAAATPAFTTSDGIDWYLLGTTLSHDVPLADNTYKLIVVDVNGSKKPNCGEESTTPCTGSTIPDRYQIGVRYDGKLRVTGTTAQNILLDPTKNR